MFQPACLCPNSCRDRDRTHKHQTPNLTLCQTNTETSSESGLSQKGASPQHGVLHFGNQPFANLCRTTLVRVPDRSMIMLLSFFACLTSIFAPVRNSVEMIKFVTLSTCHVTTNGSPFSRRYSTCLRPLHATLPPVVLLKIGRLTGRGNSGRSSAQLIGQDVKPDPESNNAYSAASKLASETPDCQRDSGSTQGPSAASGWCSPDSVHNSLARKATSRWSPRVS